MKKIYKITTITFIIILFLLIYYKFYIKDIEKYIDKKTKNIGTYETIKKDNYILADFNTVDNKIKYIVDEHKNKFIDQAINDKDSTYIIDFDSDLFFDNILQITYKLKTKDNNIKNDKTILINNTTKKELTFNDIFRNNKFLIKDYFPDINIDEIDKNKIFFEKDNIIIGNKDKKITINTKSMKNLFKSGNGIPSLYEGEHLTPKKFDYDMNKKLVAFTFDDGPLNEYHIKIRDLFNKYNIPATFYVIGNLVDANPDVVKQTYLDGHTIANHTYSHPGVINYITTT